MGQIFSVIYVTNAQNTNLYIYTSHKSEQLYYISGSCADKNHLTEVMYVFDTLKQTNAETFPDRVRLGMSQLYNE